MFIFEIWFLFCFQSDSSFLIIALTWGRSAFTHHLIYCPTFANCFDFLIKKPDLINLLQCFDFEKIKTDFSNLFSLFSIVSNKQKIQFLEQIIDCHIHLVSGAGIWTHYLSLYCESPPLTTNHCVSMTLLLL